MRRGGGGDRSGGWEDGQREREIVTINFPLMGVRHRNEVVRGQREGERTRGEEGGGGGKSVASDRTLAVTNSRHIVSPTLMT